MRGRKNHWIVKVLFVLLCVPITFLSLMALALGFGITDVAHLTGRGASRSLTVGVVLMMPFIAHVFLVVALVVGCALQIRKFVAWLMPFWIMPPLVVYYGLAGLFSSLELLAITAAYLWAWFILADRGQMPGARRRALDCAS